MDKPAYPYFPSRPCVLAVDILKHAPAPRWNAMEHRNFRRAVLTQATVRNDDDYATSR
jgi:hypothetical protein